MSLLALTAGIIGLCMAAMAVGLVMGRRLKGSCGGIINDKDDCFCERAGIPRQCEQPSQELRE